MYVCVFNSVCVSVTSPNHHGYLAMYGPVFFLILLNLKMQQEESEYNGNVDRFILRSISHNDISKQDCAVISLGLSCGKRHLITRPTDLENTN